MSESITDKVDIKLFGDIMVHAGGKPLPTLRSKKGLWLLALLALRKDIDTPRTHLAAMLWPDSLEEQALSSLRRTLTDLRHALQDHADCIVAPTPRTLKLDPDLTHVDLWIFDVLAESDASEDLETAIVLYAGPLAEQCPEEWILQERSFREHAYLQALETLARRAFEAKEHTQAIELLRQLIAVSPLREEAQRLLLRALAATNDLAAVTLAYRKLRLYLHEHLKCDPDPETTALYHLLRSQKSTEPRSFVSSKEVKRPTERLLPNHSTAQILPETNLLRPLTRLIGRQSEQENLLATVKTYRLTTLTGIGGVGKTRLATEMGWLALPHFDDGVWFFDLTTLNKPLIAEALASLLKIPEQPGQPLETTLALRLSGKKILLIFDNCEHLTQECATLASTLLGQCPNLHIFATSRQPLGIPGEQIQVLSPLQVPRLDNDGETSPAQLLKSSMQNEALCLFVERSSAVDPSFELNQQNIVDAVDICRQLDGIPLAIELAAARVKVLTVAQIARRLQDRFKLLTDQSRHTSPRQRTLQALIDWSYDLLNEAERALLRRLSVFVGSWTLDACETVCEGTPISREEILPLLAELIDKSLISLFQSGPTDTDGRRYCMLETVRQYGRERLDQAGEVPTYLMAHSEFYLNYALATSTLLPTQRAPEALAILEIEHDNIRAALQNLSDPIKKLELADALAKFWHERSYNREGRAWLEAALSVYPSDANRALVAHALHGIGILARAQGDLQASFEFSMQSLQISRDLQDLVGQALALNNLGIYAMDSGDSESAYRYYTEGVLLAEQAGNTHTLTRLYNNLGRTYLNDGRMVEARRMLEMAREVGARESDLRPFIAATGNLAEISYIEGNYHDAHQLWHKCLEFDTQRDFKWGIASTHRHLGQLALASGDLEASRHHFAEALRRSIKLADYSLTTFVLEGFASIALLEGMPERALLLIAGSDCLRNKFSAKAFYQQQQQIDMDIRAARNLLGPTRYELVWSRGYSKTVWQLAHVALAALGSDDDEFMIQ